MRVAAWVLMMAAIGVSAQTLHTKTYGTTGHPTEAMATPDGQYVLVTVNRAGASGIDIFHDDGKKLERVAFQPLGAQNAQGILLIPHTQVLAVGMSNAGVAFLPLKDVLKGKAQVRVLPQGQNAGSGYMAATADGKVLFVANEYGDGGNVGVILLQTDERGEPHPETVVHISTGNATPGVAVSPDGSRMYAVGEVIPPDLAEELPGHDLKELRRPECEQGGGRAMPNGAMYVMDIAKMAALHPDAAPAEIRASRAGWTDAGCSPVREAVSEDGSMVYVTARGDNSVLVFDAAKLSNTGNAALVAAIPSGGEAPVGLHLFDGGKSLLVANSNRFSGGNGNAVVLDVSDPKNAVLKQKIKTGAFPRNITASADGKTLYLTIFLGDELMVLSP